MFFPGTDWIPATGFVATDFLMNVLSTEGVTGEVKPGVQLCTVRTDKASAGSAITAGNYESTVDMHQYRETASYSSSAFVRFGWMGKLAAGQTGQCVLELEMDIAIKHCGAVLGSKLIEAQPYLTGTDEANSMVIPVTDWSPTVGVDKFKAMFVVIDNQNTALEYILRGRVAKDRMSPGAWVDIEAAYNNPAAGSSERNTGELSIPGGLNFSTRSLFQLGVGLRKKSGSSGNPRAILQTMTHIKYS